MTELPTMPFAKPDLLRLAPTVREIQAANPISRVRTATGDLAWYVTGYAEAKELFGDPRLGRSHPKPDEAARISNSPLLGGASDDYDHEDEHHAMMRRRLVPCFSAGRMRALTPRVEALVDGLLDDLATRKPTGKPSRDNPVDLHEALSFPLPVLVICELLGVPYADREDFRTWSTGMADLSDAELATKSMERIGGYLNELVARKRVEPADDILSELIAVEDGAMSDEDVAGFGTIVLFAGHETTVVRIDIGTLLLLTNPGQRDRLITDEGLVSTAVEEIMRLGSAIGGPTKGGLPRYARTDIEIGGVTIRAGEAVLLATNAANLDERAFPEADAFDIGRKPAGAHLGFGHGARYCIGATLARIELKAVFSRLFQRFPGLELAVPVSDLRWRENLLTGGFAELPVTW